jgi:hypothetical protein
MNDGPGPAASPAMSLMQPQAEVNSEYQQARDRPLRIGGAAQEVIQTPKPELESCAKNSVTTNGAAIKPTLLNKPREVRSVNDRRVFSVSSGSSAWVPQAQLICPTGRQVRLRRVRARHSSASDCGVGW